MVTFSSAIVSVLVKINGPLDVYLDFLWKHLYFVGTELFFDLYFCLCKGK